MKHMPRFARNTLILLLTTAIIGLAGCGQRQATPNPPQSSQQVEEVPTSPAASDAALDETTEETDAVIGEVRTFTIIGEQSQASYAVDETFLNRNLDATAVGTTSAITGTLILTDGRISPSTVTVDLRTLKSDSDRRDQYIQRNTLETDKYPMAEFTITGVDGTSPRLDEGQTENVKLAGRMSIHGVEKPLVFDVRMTVHDNTLQLEGTTTFMMSDFELEPPNILGLISVREEVTLNVSLVAQEE